MNAENATPNMKTMKRSDLRVEYTQRFANNANRQQKKRDHRTTSNLVTAYKLHIFKIRIFGFTIN